MTEATLLKKWPAETRVSMSIRTGFAPGSRRFWTRALVASLIVNAIVLCVSHYLSFRSLWLDEAFVAENLRMRSLPGLFSTLENGQLFPRAYLSAIWLLKSWIVYDLWTIRLLPLLFGIGAIFLWARVFWEEFSSQDALLAPLSISLFVTNHFIFYYAGELKQYTADLFWSAFCFWYARHALAPAFEKSRSIWTVAVIGWGVPVLTSYTYPFVAFAVGTWFALDRLRPFRIAAFLRLAALGGFAAVMFALLYKFDASISAGGNINHYWRDYYITGATFSQWVASAWVSMERVIGRWWVFPATPFLTALGVLGAIVSMRKNRGAALPFAGGLLFLLVMALAALKQYPAEYGRMQLFFFPYAVAMIVAGVAFFLESGAKVMRWAGVALAVCLFALTLGWKIPTVSKSNYKVEHWEDLNAAMRSLNPAEAKVALFSHGSRSQVLSYAHLPANIPLIYSWHFIAGEHRDFFKRTYLADGFYFIYAYPNGELEEIQRVMPDYTSVAVVPHLYKFTRSRPEGNV